MEVNMDIKDMSVYDRDAHIYQRNIGISQNWCDWLILVFLIDIHVSEKTKYLNGNALLCLFIYKKKYPISVRGDNIKSPTTR